MSFDLPGVEPGTEIESLFKAVGFVVVQWGFAEQSLDLMVSSIFHWCAGDPLLKKRPKMLEPKIDFLRHCFTQLPALAQFSEQADTLLARFAVVGKKRHDLVHGSIKSMSPENGAFKFLKIDVTKTEIPSIRVVSLDQADWPEFRRELLRLGREGQSLAEKVQNSLKERTY